MEKNGARFHVGAFIFHARCGGGDLRRLAREGGRGETREQFMEEERETFFHVGVLLCHVPASASAVARMVGDPTDPSAVQQGCPRTGPVHAIRLREMMGNR